MKGGGKDVGGNRWEIFGRDKMRGEYVGGFERREIFGYGWRELEVGVEKEVLLPQER